MTIIPRGDKHGVKVWDSAKRGYRWVGTFDTHEQAEQAERDAITRPGDTRTVDQWARVWLADYARPASATRRTYAYAVRQITDALHRRRLDAVSRPEARKLANEWPRNTSRVARTMWADAVRDGICETNPWTNLRLETPKGRKDLDALTEQQVRGLAAIAATVHRMDYADEAAAIILTLGFVGIRPGELCALRAADYDPDARELTVRYSVDGAGAEKAPKNGKPRIVTVPPDAGAALDRLPTSIDGYLLHTVHGRRFSKGTLHYFWRPIAAAWREHGGAPITPYHLRHAAATIFLERGATPADVAVQLGHTDGGRLVQVLYGHPAEANARDRLKMAFSTPAPDRLREARRG